MAPLKKTLFLAEKYPPAIGGSCNMFASRFGRYPAGKIQVLAGAIKGDAEHDRSLGYPVRRVPLVWRGPKGFEWLGVSWQLIKTAFPMLWTGRIGMIECSRPIPEGFAGYVLAWLSGKPLIINFHGEDISVLSRYRVERWILKRIIRKAKLNLANSNFTLGLVESIGGPGIASAVVHPGFNPAGLGQADPARLQSLRERFGPGPIVATVGRIQRRKGQDNVIKALASLAPRFPSLKYLVVGGSQGGTEGLAGQLRHSAESLGIADRIAFIGEVPANELADYFSFCDIFIMPNRVEGAGDVEGFGIVFLEAGSMGKPVIGGRSGGVPDAVKHGETGLLVDGESVPAISEALERLLTDPALAREMGIRGKEYSLSMTDERVFDRYVETLSETGL